MTGTGDWVRTGPPEILRRLSAQMETVRGDLAGIGGIPHTVLDVLPADALPADVAALFGDVRRANEELVERLATMVSGADRSIALTVHALNFVATKYPETDADNAARLALVDEALDVPSAPDPRAVDPRFTSPVRPR